MKQTKQDFLQFLQDQKIVSLSIAVVIGSAAKELVTSTVNNLIMPIVGIFTPSGSWRQITITILNSEFGIGQFLGSSLDFFIIALIVFVVTQKILKFNKESSKVKNKHA